MIAKAMNLGIILLRFFITFILSLMFGLERQKSHKLIGFGTFIFVAMGSCGLAIAAVVMSPENPLAFMGAIVTGIGFLGASILKGLQSIPEAVTLFAGSERIMYIISQEGWGFSRFFVATMLSVSLVPWFLDTHILKTRI